MNKIIIGFLILGISWNSWMYVDNRHTQLNFNRVQAELSNTQAELEETTSKLASAKVTIITTESKVRQLEQKLKVVPKSGTSLSRGGEVTIQNIQVVATAYTHTGNATKTGVMPEVGHIAVDPSFISLGSRVHIEGMGDFKATDTGRLIKGNKIDIFMSTEGECIEFGIKKLSLQILK